ncbi:hypothetical protein Tco_0559213 [Tanacetum coccineum]
MYLNLWSYKAVRLRYSNPMIQPEPEGSTQGYPLVSVEVLRFDTSAGNPVKEILLKLNLPDHWILKDEGEVLKSKNFKEVSITLIPNLSRSDEVLKLKNFKKDAPLKLFKESHKFTRWQKLQDGETRLCLVDDLKVFKITFSLISQDKGTSSNLKSMITTSNHKLMIGVKRAQN